jgi:hypothetical protein
MKVNLMELLASLQNAATRRAVLGMAFVVAISACAPPPKINSVTESLQINSIKITVPDKSRHGDFKWVFGRQANTFPSESIGLSKEKIQRDFSNVARREILPAFSSGQRKVNVEIEIYSMRLKGPTARSSTVPTLSSSTMIVVMDVKDTVTGAVVISEEWIAIDELWSKSVEEIREIIKTEGNYIRSYDTLLKLFPLEMKKRLLK